MGQRLDTRITIAPLALLSCAALCFGPAYGADKGATDEWLPFRPLLGTWQGVGNGFGGVSDVTHEWAFVIDGKFLRLQTRSVVRDEGGPGPVHEDVGYVSHDTDHTAHVFRQFLSEGFVNTYDVQVDPDGAAGFLFAYRECESAGGMRAQLRLSFDTEDEYTMTLDLASSGDTDFRSCQEMKMRRVR